MPYEETASGRDHRAPDRADDPGTADRGSKKSSRKTRKESPFMDRTGRMLSGRAGRHTGGNKGKGRKGRK